MPGPQWMIFSFVSAFFIASSDALTKKALFSHNEYLVAFLRLFTALPFLFVAFWLFEPTPDVGRSFFLTILVALPLELLAFVLYVKALKYSPLSLTLPFLSLTPVFLIVVPRLLLGESLSATGSFGVLLITAGGYMLNIKEIRKGFLEPFRAIGRERGSIYMIVVALIYSITATLSKKAIALSSPLFFISIYCFSLIIVFSPLVLFKTAGHFSRGSFGKTCRATFLSGLFDAFSGIAQVLAMTTASVAYVISIKRFSLLIGIFYGYVFFKETGLGGRFAGALLMLTGFSMIIAGQ